MKGTWTTCIGPTSSGSEGAAQDNTMIILGEDEDEVENSEFDNEMDLDDELDFNEDLYSLL